MKTVQNEKKKGTIKSVWTFNGIVHYKETDNPNERGKKVFHNNDIYDKFPNDWNNT